MEVVLTSLEMLIWMFQLQAMLLKVILLVIFEIVRSTAVFYALLLELVARL